MEKTDNKKAKSITEEFKKAATPLLKYLNNKHHPHVTAIITSTSIELVEGICAESEIYDYLID